MPEAPAPVAVCLMGPTATGKTDLAIALADRLPLCLNRLGSARVHPLPGTRKDGRKQAMAGPGQADFDAWLAGVAVRAA